MHSLGSPSQTGESSVLRETDLVRTPRVAYVTDQGKMIEGTIESSLEAGLCAEAEGAVQLLLTSPPFPLNRKKKYGNLQGQDYIDWLSGLAPRLGKLLTPTGSLVIELGNAWVPGEPVMSTLALEALLAFRKSGRFKLCQTFVWHNPARLPTPAQWVNVERIRVKDAFTHVWWMSRTSHPKADNRRVLKEYSRSMKDLLQSGRYNDGQRPSEHRIGRKSFLKDNGGAIPSNVLTVSNTASRNDAYLDYCRTHDIDVHPARMPKDVVAFFVKYLSDDNDLIFDPFAGSNTTGAVAEQLKRRWISIEPESEYVQGSLGRFPGVHMDL